MDIAINVYVWNSKDSSSPNQKKTSEAVRAPTYALQEKEKKKKEKSFVVVRLTHCCFF